MYAFVRSTMVPHSVTISPVTTTLDLALLAIRNINTSIKAERNIR